MKMTAKSIASRRIPAGFILATIGLLSIFKSTISFAFQEQGAADSLRVTRVVVDTVLRKGETLYLAAASGDLCCAAVMIKSGKKVRIRYQGSDGEDYDAIRHINMSPIGSRCGYVAARGKDTHVVVDNKPVGKYVMGPDSITFNSDGTHYIFEALRKYHPLEAVLTDAPPSYSPVMVLDGVENQYDGILGPVPSYFSPDGKHFAYVVRRGDKPFMVIDGVEGRSYDSTGLGPIFSDDGKRVAYLGKRDSRWYLVINGVEYGGYSVIGSYALAPHDSSFAYTAKIDQSWFFVLSDKKIGPYEHVWDPTFSPDGKRYAFLAMKDSLVFAVVDTIKSDPFEDVTPVFFSPDGKRYAYGVFAGRSLDKKLKQAVVVDRKQQEYYSYIYWNSLEFSPDGSRVGYSAEIETLRVVAVVDSTKGAEYRNVFGPVFSPDSKSYCYAAQLPDQNWCVVRNGVPGPAFEKISWPVFSPDSKHLAYHAMGNGQYHLVIDGRELEDGYDRVLPSTPVFDSVGKMTFFGSRAGNVVYRVTISQQ